MISPSPSHVFSLVFVDWLTVSRFTLRSGEIPIGRPPRSVLLGTTDGFMRKQ